MFFGPTLKVRTSKLEKERRQNFDEFFQRELEIRDKRYDSQYSNQLRKKIRKERREKKAKENAQDVG